MNNRIKKTLLASALSGALMVGGLTGGTAMAEVSANIGLTSNYLFRGVSESDDDAAISGGLDYEHASGFYVGTWMSSLGGGGDYELDLYLGFSGEAGDIGYDVGYIAYTYPRSDDADFGEVYGELSFMNFYGSLAYVTNADDGDLEGTISYELGAEFDVASDMTAGARIGYVDFDDSAAEDYTWYGIFLTKSDFEIGIVRNDLTDDDDLRAYVSYTMSF